MQRKFFSRKLFFQSLPSLLLSLAGLSIAGRWLDQSIPKKLYTRYPLLLISSCILSFKGNVELILAMHLSTMSQSVNMQQSKYNRYTFDNSCLVFLQSIAIGLSVGLVATTKVLIMDEDGHLLVIKMLTSCLLSCFASSLLIIFMLVLSIKVSILLKINPDHVILPAISSFGDLISVTLCIFFIDVCNRMTEKSCVVSVLGMGCLLPGLVYVSVKSRRRIPQQTTSVIIMTYLLSTTAGYILDFYSATYKVLAAHSPVFSGLCGSISYVYLNKKATISENRTGCNIERAFYTLLIMSVVIPVIYIALTYVVFPRLPFLFYILFVISFILHVYILLWGIESTTKSMQNLDAGISVSAIPLLTSFSDVIGVVFLIIIAKSTSLYEHSV